jgi:hypothetical protein
MAKKECDICGGKIGLLGNRKLDDGNCCKDCAHKLSPWMTDRRKTTIADIKQHLAYREENKRKLDRFNPTSIAGEDHTWRVYMDPNMGAFIVSNSKNWRNDNPDLILLSQVTSCEIERIEHKKEVYQQMADGTKKSYFPARYDYTYDFKAHIRVNSPWFQEIDFGLNTLSVDRYDQQYRQYEAMGDQIRAMLGGGFSGGGMPMGMQGMNMPGQFQQPMMGGMQQGFQQPGQFQPPAPPPQPYQQQPMQQAAPAANWFCQSCGAQNQGGFCQSCGAPKG